MAANQTTNEIRSIAERIRHMHLTTNPNPSPNQSPEKPVKKEIRETNTKTESNELPTPIGIFWDIENCRIKRGFSFLQVSKAIREKFLTRYWEAEFTVVCDVLKEPERSITEINAAQVSLIHCASTSKNAADEKLKQLIRKFADVHKSKCSIVLVSNDVNFAGDLFSLRYRNQIHVILVHSKTAAANLIACANEHYDFDLFFEANQLATTAAGQHVDFRVSNLPTDQTNAFIRNRLSRLSENCGGKVVEVKRHDSLCEAIVRFPNSNSALRAQQRMDGENIYGKRITLQNVSGPVSSSSSAVSSTSSLLSSSSNSLVARRNLPFNRYAAYPPHNRQQRHLTNIAETAALQQSYHQQQHHHHQQQQHLMPYSWNYDFSNYNHAWSTETTTATATAAAAVTTLTTTTSLAPSSSPIDLLVTNLDPRFHPQTMKQTLSDLFKNCAMVLNVSVTIQSEGNMVAHVKVANLQDAQLAISKLQRIKIGYKRITIQFAPERVDLFLLRSQIVLLLQEVPGCRLPLFKFLELFKARFRSAISLSILYKLRDVCSISDDFYGNIKSRFISLVIKDNGDGSVRQQQYEEEQQQFETWFCPKHYTNVSSEKGWAELDSIKMPNVTMPLNDFSTAIYSLLDAHNGYLPLYSLPYCYAAVIGDLKTHEDGVPLEHYVTCVPDIELCTSPNRVKYLKWSMKPNADECCDTIDGGGSECGQKSMLSSTPLAVKISLLSRELVDLLKTIKKCRMPLSKFIPAYHHHFGRQCRVADYGYTKLDDLLDALDNVIQVMGEGEARLITLNHQTQTKRFTYDLLKVLKFQKNKQILCSEFAATFERIVNKKFDPVDYGLCSLDDLLANISKNMVLVTRVAPETAVVGGSRNNGPVDFIISVPKKEQSAEEIMRTKHFALEAVELLRHMPQCTLLFRKFVTAYHHHFGRQCRLSDYGFTKLIELFETIPDVVRIDDSYDLDKKICLTLPYHMRIVGEQLVNVIRRSRNEKIALDEIASVYMKEYGYGLQPEIFDCHNIDELVLRLSDFVQLSYEKWAIFVIVKDGTRIEQLILRVWSVLINVPHCLPTFVFLKEYLRKHNSSFELCQLHELNSVINIMHAGQSKITISLTPFYVMLAKIYWLLYDHDGCLPLADFSREYCGKYREQLQPVQFGSNDLFDLLQKMIHVLVIEGDEKQNPLVWLSPDLKAFNVDLPSSFVSSSSSSTSDFESGPKIGNDLTFGSSTSFRSPIETTRKYPFPTIRKPVKAPATAPPTKTTLTATNGSKWTPFNTPNLNPALVNIGALLPKLRTPKIDRDYLKSLYYSPAKNLMSAYTGKEKINRSLFEDLSNMIDDSGTNSSSNNSSNDSATTTKSQLNQPHQNAPDPSQLPFPNFF